MRVRAVEVAAAGYPIVADRRADEPTSSAALGSGWTGRSRIGEPRGDLRWTRHEEGFMSSRGVVGSTLHAVRFLFVGPLILVLLFFINLLTSPGHWWVQWAALGIGIAWFVSLFRVMTAALVVGGLAALWAMYTRGRTPGTPPAAVPAPPGSPPTPPGASG
jgi:hypothetical protein